MPPSQIKRLKSSLREQGITGPPKSKKQKKSLKASNATSDRNQRNAALQHIRDSFNPFELKAPSRPAKFQHANSTPQNGARYREVLHRPGVTKSAGEEMRRRKLLPEMQRRNKVGGLVDRRIGEGDAGMSAEERAVQRFAREKQRKKGAGLFDLEGSDEDETELGLTHGGRSLGDLPEDGALEQDSIGGEMSDDDGELMRRKRRRSEVDEDEVDGSDNGSVDEQPERKKSKKEVMDEVIAKSKLHKYERQKVKEDDDDLREELDKGTDDILSLLKHRETPLPPPKAAAQAPNAEPRMNPERQRLLEGVDRVQVDREYDERLKKLALDTRAKPSERTKTEEEKIREEAERLRELEERRLRRMKGEQVDEEGVDGADDLGDDIDDPDEVAEFGFMNSNAQKDGREKVVLEDEDEFALDGDLIASDSDIDLDEDYESEQGSSEDEAQQDEENEEDEFIKDISVDQPKTNGTLNDEHNPTETSGLAFTHPCPRTHHDLLVLLKDTSTEQFPTIIQRIRALHHPQLNAANKELMADFSAVLVEHLSYMGLHHQNEKKQSLTAIEQVIRHLHSLSRTYPEVIAGAFRRQLAAMHESKEMSAGDLVIVTAIGSIYPTSDHFHQVVTPAMTIMVRWLGMTVLDSKENHATGAFLVALSLKYQRLSKRYIPEAIRFTLRALAAKTTMLEEKNRKAHLDNLMAMAEQWKDKPAFPEIFHHALALLNKPGTKRELHALKNLLQTSRLARRPLELHHHRPLPLRTSIPKFESGFNPDKHYDPDKERSDARKLAKEFKRERKGALRELRKDANFMAREGLRAKRERDEVHERKMRRLVAEVQGEEGYEGRVYEREKRARRRKGGG